MLAGDIAPIPALRNRDAYATVEHSRDHRDLFELVIWLGAASAIPYIEAGGFWSQWGIGQTFLLRFEHRTNVFNRAMFEAVHLLPFSELDKVPPGAAWFPNSPPSDVGALLTFEQARAELSRSRADGVSAR